MSERAYFRAPFSEMVIGIGTIRGDTVIYRTPAQMEREAWRNHAWDRRRARMRRLESRWKHKARMLDNSGR